MRLSRVSFEMNHKCRRWRQEADVIAVTKRQILDRRSTARTRPPPSGRTSTIITCRGFLAGLRLSVPLRM